MASRFLAPVSGRGGWFPEPLFQLQREIDRLFDDAFGASGTGSRSGARQLMTAPRIDLQEADGELRVHADMPGVKPEDLDLRVDGDVLTIRGERKSASDRDEQSYHVMERSHGRFQRSVQLPFAPDPEQVQAEMREGVLEIRMPKQAPQERNRRIEVRAASGGGNGAGTSGSDGTAAGGDGQASSAAGSEGGIGTETLWTGEGTGSESEGSRSGATSSSASSAGTSGGG